MHEEKIRFSRTSQKTQRNTNPQYPSFHKNIIKLIEALYDEPNGNSLLLRQTCPRFLTHGHENVLVPQKWKKPPHLLKIKYYMFQVIKSIDFMRKKASFTRISNPKISSSRAICQVGRSRLLQGTTQPYTDHISTRWYRPLVPYDWQTLQWKMDIWGVWLRAVWTRDQKAPVSRKGWVRSGEENS